VRDVVIGMADGLTVWFALAAGISGAIASTHIVVTAGLAEVAAGSYVVGGMIPLLPYMLAANAHQALMVSIVTLLALALFGFVKGHFTGVSKFKSAWQTALVGSLAARVAFAIAKAIS
jgi:VIT1/CCC1 family predicted Fe2+/Mn2+ transporter